MHGTEHYQQWEDFRVESKTRKRIGKTSLAQYEVVWGKWLTHCVNENIEWLAATQDDVRKFLSAIGPRSKRGATMAAAPTVKRYWRTLYELYAYALIKEMIATNPADLPQTPQTKETLSLALAPDDWQRLSDGLPGGFTPRERRNRLLLLLAMRAALTVGELTKLTVENFEQVDGVPATFESAAESALPLFQPESPHWQATEKHPIYSVTIDSHLAVRRRTLILDARTSKAVHDWLECRVYYDKSARASHDRTRALFVASDALKAMRPMDSKAMYNICHDHFMTCLGPDNKIQHLGPNTLRNTCIKNWHSQGITESELKRRLGLKADGAFRRLKDQFKPSLTLN